MSNEKWYYDTNNNVFYDSGRGGELFPKPALYFANLATRQLQFSTNVAGTYANDTRFASATAFQLAIRNNWVREVRGVLATAYSGAVVSITITGLSEIPEGTGFLILMNDAYEADSVAYTGVVNNGSGSYTFTVSKTLDYVYESGDIGGFKTDLMALVENSNIVSTNKATGLFSFTIDTETRGFQIATQDKSRASSPRLEWQAFNVSGKRIETQQENIQALNIINYVGFAPPVNIFDYYTKTQVDALLVAKADLVGADDIEITDAAKGVILKSDNGARVRLTLGNISGSYHQVLLTEL